MNIEFNTTNASSKKVNKNGRATHVTDSTNSHVKWNSRDETEGVSSTQTLLSSARTSKPQLQSIVKRERSGPVMGSMVKLFVSEEKECLELPGNENVKKGEKENDVMTWGDDDGPHGHNTSATMIIHDIDDHGTVLRRSSNANDCDQTKQN
ncbi:hypothetical protein RFI_29545 [Reticulomyxa filosa]|uniref:Uncharacterized protein n=1 Tax=Reticulomyxa filosa TaxID=46433 RepID=X6M1T4_RETFI|nr:hypothetical protein RFI_29545 [Reticulomyxa filosa]|eukprot:ETO07844.1 hypothetical protein RFI_29545 [Reticulomyxa filosa]